MIAIENTLKETNISEVKEINKYIKYIKETKDVLYASLLLIIVIFFLYSNRGTISIHLNTGCGIHL